ncbi:hypothetical protein ASF92_09640 [Pedobacter sp. Leaf176]|nr:hypothetical protein ASF92_09640 [Pedobacter sp. Leaf176]
MEGEIVKAFAILSTYHYPEAARPFRPFVGTCADEQKSFDEFIRHQVQALIVCFFIIKDKERAPSAAASRGKTEQGA